MNPSVTDSVIALNDAVLNKKHREAMEHSAKVFRISRAFTSEGLSDEGMPITYVDSISLPQNLGLENHGIEVNLPFGIMAFTNNGKTIFTENLAAFWLKKKARVTILSNENQQARSDYITDIYRLLKADLEGITVGRDELKADLPLRAQVDQWYAKSRETFNVFDIRPYHDADLIKKITRLFSEDRTDILLIDYFQNMTREIGFQKFTALDYIMASITEISGTFTKPIGLVAQSGRKGNSRDGAPNSDACEGCSRYEKDVGLLLTLKNPKENISKKNAQQFRDFLHVRVAKARWGPCTQLSVGLDFTSRLMTGVLSEMEHMDYVTAMKQERKKWST